MQTLISTKYMQLVCTQVEEEKYLQMLKTVIVVMADL